MALRKIKNTFYVYYRDLDGKHKTRSLKTSDPVQAEKMERQYMALLQNRKSAAVLFRDFPEMKNVFTAPIAEHKKPGEHRRGGIALSAMLDCASKKRRLGKDHILCWNRFLDWCKVGYADQVTPQIAQAYLEEKYSDGNGKSFNNNRTMLNTIFRCCLVEAGLNASPFSSVINRRVEDVENHRNLTEEEFDRVLEACPVDMKILAMLSRWTAQRLETCTRITPEMFDFERLVFVIRPGKTSRFNKWVCVPIMPDLEKFIKPILPKCKPGIPIFENFCKSQSKTNRVRNSKLSVKFSEILKSLNICDTDEGKASFHSLRGTAITWFKEHGVKGDDLKSITGHATDEVEEVYARDIASLERIAHGLRDK